MTPLKKQVLFLQGPHGPFFVDLARELVKKGCRVLRVGFNRGDELEWPKELDYLPYNCALADWPTQCEFIMRSRNITDIVLYGDIRHYNRIAIETAHRLGIAVHIVEEGYIRPFWVTYEQDGVNGHSRIVDLPLDAIDEQALKERPEPKEAPTHWGSTRQHIYWSLRYHFQVLFWNGRYPTYERHRRHSLGDEFRVWRRRIAAMPFSHFKRRRALARLEADRRPYHLALLQLGSDSSMSAHSDFGSVSEFMDHVAREFSKAGLQDETLVFKAHPLEDGREKLDQVVERLAQAYGLEGRMHYIDGGALAELLNDSRIRSAVTVNSTAAQQSLWRGLPTMALGRAIYVKPELTSDQASLAEFFRAPKAPDRDAYMKFRAYLEATCQIQGGFYTQEGRNSCIPVIAERIVEDSATRPDYLRSEYGHGATIADQTSLRSRQRRASAI